MRTIVWSTKAGTQLLDAIAYVAADNTPAAWRLHDRIVSLVDQLSEFPHLGAPGRMKGTRELVITGTRYVAVYRVRESAIEIAYLWHSAQRRKRR